MISASDALARLQEGNRRFAADASILHAPDGGPSADEARRSELVEGQDPIAVILGCADARVPAELIFDQGLGDLFVIRVAGNIVTPTVLGSAEYAATQCGTRLVVVLGHSGCGAVQATLDELEQPSDDLSPNLRAIVDRVRPAVEPLRADAADRAALMPRAVQANVRASVRHLHRDSQVLVRLAQEDGLRIVGAEYALETGLVDFLDGVSEAL